MTVVGWRAHGAGVRRLEESYAAIPEDAPVRLAKRTSNLFRARSRAQAPGLDVSGLRGVIEVDAPGRSAHVQGMCTYEDLVDATLPHGLIPLVVPQLRTITLGGAVTGLGIESTSFRNGLPHESVQEMDIFTGAGDIVTVKPGDRLFDTFPNSYGSLGYATRLRIELEAVPQHVELRHVRFSDMDELATAVETIATTREWQGTHVDGLDGVWFEPGEAYLTLATWVSTEGGPTSDYTGQDLYFESVRTKQSDRLTMYDYLWRWDTDWFWCSGAFGLHNPTVRRLWPRRWRRSDVYHRLIGLDHRLGISTRLDRRKGEIRERVIQDVEVPVGRTAEYLDWFEPHVGMHPVWLCPLRLRESEGTGAREWPTYPLEPRTTYVNFGFWGTVPIQPGHSDGDVNRALEAKVHDLGGHKSLYSDAFYDEATFDALYNTANLLEVKQEFDPDGRLTGLYEKAVGNR